MRDTLRRLIWLGAAVATVFGQAGYAQTPVRPVEALARWQAYQEIHLTSGGAAGPCEFTLSAQALDGARSDLQDLRLYDAAGREIPYAVRVLLPRDEQHAHSAREFNRAAHPDRSVEVSLDLGENPGEHNRIEVATGGINYRRLLTLEGGDDGKTWKPMLDKRPLTRFAGGGSTFDGTRIDYAVSRYRYLRTRVAPDPALERDAPEAPQVRVLRTVRVVGRELPWPAALSNRQPVRESLGGEYSSEWFVSLPGQERVPWHQLELDADEAEFTRTYRVEVADEKPSYSQDVIQGEWRRVAGKREKLTIRFDPEIPAKRLRLIIVDQRNIPLTVRLLSASAAARQFIFDRPPDAAGPFRLYFGCPDAENPGYDYARTLPEPLTAVPTKAEPGGVFPNPTYLPPRLPLTERSPLVTYFVFGIVAIVLMGILVLLARKAIATHDAIVGRSGEVREPIARA